MCWLGERRGEQLIPPSALLHLLEAKPSGYLSLREHGDDVISTIANQHGDVLDAPHQDDPSLRGIHSGEEVKKTKKKKKIEKEEEFSQVQNIRHLSSIACKRLGRTEAHRGTVSLRSGD